MIVRLLSPLQSTANWSVREGHNQQIKFLSSVPCLHMLTVPGHGEAQAHFNPGHLEVAQCLFIKPGL